MLGILHDPGIAERHPSTMLYVSQEAKQEFVRESKPPATKTFFEEASKRSTELSNSEDVIKSDVLNQGIGSRSEARAGISQTGRLDEKRLFSSIRIEAATPRLAVLNVSRAEYGNKLATLLNASAPNEWSRISCSDSLATG